MSNVDMSQVITAQAKCAADAAAHLEVAKGVCRQRILSVFPLEAQQNLTAALSRFAVERANDTSAGETAARCGLNESDVALIEVAQDWIAQMQERCREMAKDAKVDPEKEEAWPAPPEGLAALVARY